MSTIRCKMICHAVTPNPHASQDDPKATVTFGAVWTPESGSPGDENAIFGKYTPWAEYKACWALSVAEKLEVGAAYYFDIHKA